MAMKNLGLKVGVRFFLLIIFVVLLVFWPAGTFNWPEAWIYFGIMMAYFIPTFLYLKKHSPELLEKRARMKPKFGWDMVILSLSGLFITATFVLSGLDAVRFQWTIVPLELKAVSFVVIALSYIGLFLVMKENAFLSRIAEIQKDHKVVSTGPYRIVRHPMYAVVMAMFTFTPLALGSYYALIPALLSDIIIVERTIKEDKMLHEGLAGYKEYAQKTRYRLLPGIW